MQLERWIHAMRMRLRSLFRREAADRELDEELQYHVDRQTEENIAKGLTPQEARRQALIETGGIERVKENCRDARGLRWAQDIAQDARFALRMLRRNPGFTTVAVLTLALGIGANTAIFSVVNTVLLQPLPYPQANRMVELIRTFQDGSTYPTVSIAKYMVWRNRTDVFEAFAVSDHGSGDNLMTGGELEQVNVVHASAGYFAVYGAAMEKGRTFTPAEDLPGGPHVAVISNALWRNRMGGDPNFVGQTIRLGGTLYEVVGVASSSFSPDPPVDIWLPLQADPNSTSQTHNLLVVARLKPGVTLAKAQAAMAFAVAEFRRKFGANAVMGDGEGATAVSLRDSVVGDVRPALLLLLGSVAFVLLIACANMASLLLSRATSRRREIAIRSALGAGRRRIVFQLLVESTLLSMSGGVLGLALGYFGVHALFAMDPGNIPRVGQGGAAVMLDWKVLVFTVLVSAITGILFGVLPAFHASKPDVIAEINEGGARFGTSLRENKSRSVFVVTEVALAVILVAGAALLIRTFAALRSVNPGLELHNALTMQTRLTGEQFATGAGLGLVAREGERRLEGLPGVKAAAIGAYLPFSGREDMPFTIDARPPTNDLFSGDVEWRFVSPGYFDVFQIPLVRGRLFEMGDDTKAAPVVLISEKMARQYWPNQDPIGQLITIGGKFMGPEFVEPPRRIIGIVADVKDENLRDIFRATMYVPMGQISDALAVRISRGAPMTWMVRTSGNPYALSAGIQRELRAATGGLPVGNVRSMDQLVSAATARSGFNMVLLSIFAGIALLLAMIGVYGLVAYSVQQRTREIGIRVALGAQRGDVLKMVLQEGLTLCALGIAVGISGAFAVTRLMKSLIFDVRPTDPTTFAGVVVLLALVGLTACWIPARRAMRVDPMVALRHE